MDASIFNFANNSDTDQEIELYDTSSQGSGSALQPVWNFKKDWAFTPKEGPTLPYIYEEDTLLFWDQSKNPEDGALGIRLWAGTVESPTTFIRSYTGALLNDITVAGLLSFLQTNVNFSDIGTWSIEGPFDRTHFIIRVIPTAAFIADNNILVSGDSSTSRTSDAPRESFNYGVQSMIAEGTGWQSVLIYPRSYQVAPSLVANPNVSVTSYRDFGYDEFLWSTIQRTYDIKNFQIFSTNQNQLLEPFLFDRTLATGRVYQKVLTPTIDPYQQQNYIITPEDKGYILDGFTKVKYKVLAFSNVRLVLDYTYIDLSTPLLIKKVKKPKRIQKEIYSNQSGNQVATPQNTPTVSPATIPPAPPPAPPVIPQSPPSPQTPIVLKQAFKDSMLSGFEKFGCKWFVNRIQVQKDKLADLQSQPAGKRNPRWQDFLNLKIAYIENMQLEKECIVEEDVIDIASLGPEYERKDLWMPSPEFVQHQIDTEQGIDKLLNDHDFPIEKE